MTFKYKKTNFPSGFPKQYIITYLGCEEDSVVIVGWQQMLNLQLVGQALGTGVHNEKQQQLISHKQLIRTFTYTQKRSISFAAAPVHSQLQLYFGIHANTGGA